MQVRAAILILGALLLSGCATTSVRSQSPEDIAFAALDVRLVGDLAVADGMQPAKVEAVGLVSGLAGTGSDPSPSPERSMLLDDMQKRGVINPNQILASPSTALVLVRGYLRPGIQKGEHFDIEVRAPSRSETTSLRDGWLMETRMRELAAINNQLREGHLLALAQGPILVDPVREGNDALVRQVRGRVLGGGVALKSRPLRLLLKPDNRSVRNSMQIGTALNQRFHTFVQGVKRGVATPKTDEFVELIVHPRYKDNIARYMQVVRAVPVGESPSERMLRLKLLRRQLLDPISADLAALRLEALGKEGIDVLVEGTAASDPLVCFYAAEALAYLDDSRAVAPLAVAAREQPACRVFALAALGAMEDFVAAEALREMLDLPSAETRYGAFRALSSMQNRDPLVQGEMLGGQFSYHLIPTSGPPLTHLTRSQRSEVVLFGPDQHFQTPLVIEASKQIMLKSRDGDTIAVSRFATGEQDQQRVVSTKVDDVIRAIVDIGGSYPDVVQALQQAKAQHALSGRLEVDALPQPGRAYEASAPASEETKSEDDGLVVSNPVPDLFVDESAKSERREAESNDPPAKKNAENSPAGEEKGAAPKKGLLGKITR